jgi:hypothetical protein
MFSTSNSRDFTKFEDLSADEEHGRDRSRTRKSLQWSRSLFPTNFNLLFLESNAFLKRCKHIAFRAYDSDGVKALLPELPEHLQTDSAADILQARISEIAAQDPAHVPDLSKLLPRILWKRLLFTRVLYVLQVIFSLASPLVTFALLRWAEDQGSDPINSSSPPCLFQPAREPLHLTRIPSPK